MLRRSLFLLPLLVLFLASNAGAVTLNWTDNSLNEDGFKIEKQLASSINPNPNLFNQIGTTGPGVTTFIDATGAAGDCYRVRAFNTAGDSAFTNVACILNPPTGLKLSLQFDGTFQNNRVVAAAPPDFVLIGQVTRRRIFTGTVSTK